MNHKDINLTKLEMLDAFYIEIKQIYKEYAEGNFNNFEFQRQINRYYHGWEYCRMDFRNTGGNSNAINCVSNDDYLNVSKPQWLDNGRGCVLRSENKKLNLIFECRQKGNLIIYLRGEDFRNIYHKRVPVYINYETFKFNDKVILYDTCSTWHDESYIYHDNCEDNERISIEIEYKTIYDYFPELIDFKNNFVKENNKNTVINTFNKFKEYIYQKRYELTTGINDDSYWLKQYVKISHELTDLKVDYDIFKKNTNKILDSYNILFDSIFKYHQLEPKKLVRYSREMNNLLLDFIDHVCKKHNLKWWMNFGILIGAIRHGENVPWDDDYDISMMRDDYEKFYTIIHEELKLHNLNKKIYVNFNKTGPNNSLLSFMKFEYFDNGRLFGFVDIIPYDYVSREIDNAENTFHQTRREFLDELRNGVDREVAFKKYFDTFNVSQTKTDIIIGGVEANYYMQTDYDTIFPLKNIPFEDRYYPAPNDSKGLLEQRYSSEIMKVPKMVYNHSFFEALSTRYADVYEIFERNIAIMKKVNAEMENEY